VVKDVEENGSGQFQRIVKTDLSIGDIDHLYISPATTSNQSAITNLHILQITTTPPSLFPVSCVFNSRSLAKTLTVEILQLASPKSLLSG
jgi:hypothetical protein